MGWRAETVTKTPVDPNNHCCAFKALFTESNYKPRGKWIGIDWEGIYASRSSSYSHDYYSCSIEDNVNSYQLFDISACETGNYRKNNECLSKEATSCEIDSLSDVRFMNNDCSVSLAVGMIRDQHFNSNYMTVSDFTEKNIVLAGRICLLVFADSSYTGKSTLFCNYEDYPMWIRNDASFESWRMWRF